MIIQCDGFLSIGSIVHCNGLRGKGIHLMPCAPPFKSRECWERFKWRRHGQQTPDDQVDLIRRHRSVSLIPLTCSTLSPVSETHTIGYEYSSGVETSQTDLCTTHPHHLSSNVQVRPAEEKKPRLASHACPLLMYLRGWTEWLIAG